jgi:hypothetical protein
MRNAGSFPFVTARRFSSHAMMRSHRSKFSFFVPKHSKADFLKRDHAEKPNTWCKFRAISGSPPAAKQCQRSVLRSKRDPQLIRTSVLNRRFNSHFCSDFCSATRAGLRTDRHNSFEYNEIGITSKTTSRGRAFEASLEVILTGVFEWFARPLAAIGPRYNGRRHVASGLGMPN